MSFLLILLLVPFVVCLGIGLHVLNALEIHSISLRGILYIATSFHQHSECVYLGGGNKYTRFTYILNIIFMIGVHLFVKYYVNVIYVTHLKIVSLSYANEYILGCYKLIQILIFCTL